MTVSIIGTGSYLPERILTNADLEKMVDTSDEWIVTRTGMKERHIARNDEAASAMGAMAARRALECAGVNAEEIDMLIVATATPDGFIPSTACVVQTLVGARNAFCFDISSACSGFLYALEIARRFVESGAVRTVLICATEKLSCFTDWQDRDTCVLFGDGAGAAVVRHTDGVRGIISNVMGSDGSLGELLCIPGGGSKMPFSEQVLKERLHFIKMNGREVFKHAVRCMSDAAQQALERSGLKIEDVDWIVPHQANIRIVQAIITRLDASMDKCFLNIEKVGNISSASIPVALDEATRAGVIKRGDILLLVTFGSGFTWGASVLEW